MKDARGRERKCQEASPCSFGVFVPCGRDAIGIVDNGDEHPYWMCAECADHNVRNRGALQYEPAGGVARILGEALNSGRGVYKP